jgi:hypothetical protein
MKGYFNTELAARRRIAGAKSEKNMTALIPPAQVVDVEAMDTTKCGLSAARDLD